MLHTESFCEFVSCFMWHGVFITNTFDVLTNIDLMKLFLISSLNPYFCIIGVKNLDFGKKNFDQKNTKSMSLETQNREDFQ